MASPNVVIPPELITLIDEREQIWAEVDRAQNLTAQLGQLSAQVPNCTPASLQLQFGADNNPTAELATILPLLKEKIEATNKLKAEVQASYNQIEAIKQQEKMIITVAVISGVVLFLILILVLVNLL